MGANLLLLEEKAPGLDNHDQCLVDNISIFSHQGNYVEDDNYCADDYDNDEEEDDDESSSNESHDAVERSSYWESQESLLQEILDHHSSTGSKLRQEITRIIEMARETNFCRCLNPKSDVCCKCLRRRVANLLCSNGFNATLCTSQWRHTRKFPGGTHEYIELIASTQSRKKQVPFVIELNFRDEFKMGKACKEYRKLINQLVPEMFIGKPDHLNAVVRVVCDAAKRSAAEERIHMGPWRKTSFMQKKWSGSELLINRFSSSSSTSSSSSIVEAAKLHVPEVSSCLQLFPATAVEVI